MSMSITKTGGIVAIAIGVISIISGSAGTIYLIGSTHQQAMDQLKQNSDSIQEMKQEQSITHDNQMRVMSAVAQHGKDIDEVKGDVKKLLWYAAKQYAMPSASTGPSSESRNQNTEAIAHP